MKRREFIIALGGATSRPMPARSQEPAIPGQSADSSLPLRYPVTGQLLATCDAVDQSMR
jgi:hypothetical protein